MQLSAVLLIWFVRISPFENYVGKCICCLEIDKTSKDKQLLPRPLPSLFTCHLYVVLTLSLICNFYPLRVKPAVFDLFLAIGIAAYAFLWYLSILVSDSVISIS